MHSGDQNVIQVLNVVDGEERGPAEFQAGEGVQACERGPNMHEHPHMMQTSAPSKSRLQRQCADMQRNLECLRGGY